MNDVVLDAQMSDEELLKSIDSALNKGEAKFNDFVAGINTKLNAIGANSMQGMSANFSSQIDAMISKTKELNEQLNIASKGSTKVTGVSTSTQSTINVNDYQSAISGGFQRQDFELLQLNEHYRELEASSKRAFDTQKEGLKEQGSGNFQNQDFELVQLNEHYKQLEISSKRAAAAQATLFKEQRGSLTSDVSTVSRMPTNNIDEVNEKLKRLQDLRNRISASTIPLLNPAEIQSIDTKISNLNKKLETLQSKVKQPLSFGSVMGMPETTLNDISSKMKAISDLRGGYAKGATELTQLNQSYQRLSNTQREALSSGVELERRNNSLATSFTNLGKRVLFYAGLGALTGFVEQVYSIRGEYEMLERSMGALLGDFAKGSALFNQIQTQALKSPFTVIDLEGAAKQLIAYNFAESDVAKTTSRLADIASALGVPMERLVYNLGQIKAKGNLDARDARDFANAGLAVVPMLAKLYTEQKKNGDQVVTTSEVYDMMTKKLVSYADVMQVIDNATNSGGMFFDFQAKQAETLKGQLSNMIDAWNMMLNQIGSDNQGVLTGSVKLARELFANWKSIEMAVLSLTAAYGAYKASQLVVNALLGKGSVAALERVKAENILSAATLRRDAIMENASYKEVFFTKLSTKATQAQYEQAIAAQNLNKFQLLLISNFSWFNSNLRAAAMTAYGEQLGGLARFFRLANMSAKLLLLTVRDLAISLLTNPMVWLTAALAIYSAISTKNEEHKQKLKEVNDEYNELNKNISDISLKFNVAIQGPKGGDLEEAKNQLNELIKLAKDQYNITFNVDTSKLDAKQIVQKFNEIKTELDNLAIASRQFAESAVESNLGDSWEKYGQDVQKVSDLISSNKGVVVNALQAHIEKLKSLGASQKDIESEQQVLNEIMSPKKSNETQLDYLNRLIDGYNKLGLLGLGSTVGGFNAELEKLGLTGDKTFETLAGAWADMNKSGEDATKTFENQVDELGKRINLNAIPKEQRTMQLEAAINKYATDKNLNEWSREMMIKMANKKYHTSIFILADTDSQNKAEFDIKSWQGKLQNWADRNKVKLGLTLTVETTEVKAAQEAAQKVKDAAEQIEIAKRKNKAGTSTAGELQAAYANYNQVVKVAKAAGSDLSFLNKKAEKEAKQKQAAQRKALSEEAQAIKNEIDLIDKLSSSYEKLKSVGVSSGDAIKSLSSQYASSIGNINKVLGKYKLSTFNVKDFAGMNISGQLDYLVKLRNEMKAKGLDKLKPDAFKEVTAQIGKIKVEGKSYDLTKVTEELANRISGIKDSYELGIEIESNPEQLDLFSNIFHMDKTEITNAVKTAKDAANQIQGEIDKTISEYNKNNKSGVQLGQFDTLWSKEKQLKYFKDAGVDASSTFAKGIISGSKDAQDILSKDYKENIKNWETLLSKYADYEYKKNEIQKTSAKERLELIQKFGTEEQYKQALDLSNSIQISDDNSDIQRLSSELDVLTNKVAKNNTKAIPISTAISLKSTQETASLNWEDFKKGDLYQKSFEDMSRISTSTIKLIIEQMDELKDKIGSSLSPEQMKAFMQSYKQARTELEGRAPFENMVSSLKDWISATKEKKLADDELIKSENELKSLQSELNRSQMKESGKKSTSTEDQGDNVDLLNRIADATQSVSKAKIKVADADNKAKQAESEFSKAASASQQALSQAASILTSFMDLLDVDKESKFGRGLSSLVKGLTMMASVLGIIITVAALAELSLGWVAIIGAALAVIVGALTWIGGKTDTYTGMKKAVDSLAQSIDNAADKMTKFLETSAGDKATSYYVNLKKNNDAIIQSYRDLAAAAGESGSSWGSHSYAYRTNKALKDDWGGISALIGKSVNSIQDMYGLTSDELELIQTRMPTVWNSISEDIRTSLEGVIKYGDKSLDYANQLAQAYTDINFDDLTSNFKDMLSSLDTSTKDWADNFEKYMRNAIVRTLVYGDDFQTQIKNWYSQFSAAMSDEALSNTERQALQTSYNNMVKSAQDKLKNLEQAAGLDLSSSSDLSGLQQGIQSMSEETGGALEAYANNISGEIFKHTSIFQQLLNNSSIGLALQSNVLLQMQQSYQVQKAIQGILNGALANNGNSFMVTLTK